VNEENYGKLANPSSPGIWLTQYGGVGGGVYELLLRDIIMVRSYN